MRTACQSPSFPRMLVLQFVEMFRQAVFQTALQTVVEFFRFVRHGPVW